MFGGPMPMRKMKTPKIAKGSDAHEKAIKALKQKPGAKLVKHPDMTAKQAKEVEPNDLRG